uniref:Secreted protein n=1 Tax=Leersia perrieri TaxID=77586 RepID=A0A0D9V3X3_9ORYZ
MVGVMVTVVVVVALVVEGGAEAADMKGVGMMSSKACKESKSNESSEERRTKIKQWNRERDEKQG